MKPSDIETDVVFFFCYCHCLYHSIEQRMNLSFLLLHSKYIFKMFKHIELDLECSKIIFDSRSCLYIHICSMLIISQRRLFSLLLLYSFGRLFEIVVVRFNFECKYVCFSVVCACVVCLLESIQFNYLSKMCIFWVKRTMPAKERTLQKNRTRKCRLSSVILYA